MKLKNKKTGEIGWLYCDHISVPKKMTVFSENKDLSAPHWDYDTLAELNNEWEDAPEEPKVFWYLDSDGQILCDISDDKCRFDMGCKQIGNYFETKEEAEKAVEKLKAWKRLKDKGFRFCGHDDRDRGQLGNIVIYAEMPTFEYDDDSTRNDLDLLFGGEE